MSNWRDHAACVGNADLFYPAEHDFESVRAAKALCAECPVTRACLRFAMETGEVFGIWGGLGPKERRRLRSQEWHAR